MFQIADDVSGYIHTVKNGYCFISQTQFHVLYAGNHQAVRTPHQGMIYDDLFVDVFVNSIHFQL